MIQTNTSMLNQIDWNELSRVLSTREADSGEDVSYLCVVIDQSSGEIKAISNRVKVIENTIVSHAALKSKPGGSSFKLELLDRHGALDDSIKGIITATFASFNKFQEEIG
jgi:hypothetical protein